MTHLEIMKVTDTFSLKVYQHEEQRIIRISGEPTDLHREKTECIQQAGNGQQQVHFKEVLNAYHLEKWRKKPIHGYIDCKMRENDDINMKLECYMGWFPSLICKNYIFKYFVKTIEATCYFVRY